MTSICTANKIAFDPLREALNRSIAKRQTKTVIINQQSLTKMENMQNIRPLKNISSDAYTI